MKRTRPRAFVIALALVLSASIAAPVRGGMPARDGQFRMTGAASKADALLIKFFDEYARGQVTVGELPASEARQFAREVRRVAPAWAGSRTDPDSPRKRLAIGTLATDFVNQNFEQAWRPGQAGELLEWACELIRGTPPLPAERAWHLSAAILLQRASAARLIRGPVSAASPDTAVIRHLAHAERRFPDDGQWTLARAIDAEHLTWPPRPDEDVLRPPPDHENRLRDRLEDAFERDDVRAEAHLRWAYFHTRRGRYDAALEEFDEVGTPEDVVLRFWLHLLRGRTLVRMDQRADAIVEFRQALKAFPNAQSATLALGAELVQSGRAAEARELVTGLLQGSDNVDPWRAYGSPAQRYWSGLYAELRQAVVP